MTRAWNRISSELLPLLHPHERIALREKFSEKTLVLSGQEIDNATWKLREELNYLAQFYGPFAPPVPPPLPPSVLRPRVRLEVVHGPQIASLYTKTQFWGIRVYNDGDAATFQATVQVTEDRSTTLLHQPGDVVLGWSDNRDSEKELLNGAYCDLYFCAVERRNPTMPQQDRLWITGGPALSPRTVWESMSLAGKNENPFAIVAVNIYSKPAMIEGPRRLTLRLDATGLNELSARNSEVLPRPESAS